MFAYFIAAGAAAVAAGYQSMAPAGQWYGRTFTGLPRGAKKLALSFDDGPNDPYTLRLLEILDKYGVKATFFMIGRFVEQRPEIARAVAQAGHVVGNHTFSHPLLTLLPAARIRAELEKCGTTLEEVVGPHSNLFRPPFGGRRPAVLRIARQMGLQPVMWNVTAYDWKATTALRVEKNVRRQVRGGDVILLHDGDRLAMGTDRAHTVEATEELIRLYQAEGFEFVTIPQMLSAGQPPSSTSR